MMKVWKLKFKPFKLCLYWWGSANLITKDFMKRYTCKLKQLEQLISLPRIFECEETSRFMKLLYAACRSSKVPEAQLYSIIKRVLQNTVSLPPHRQLWTVSFVFNLVKKHQTLKKYLQNLNTANTSDEHYWELQVF